MDFGKFLRRIAQQSDELVPAASKQVDELAEESLPAIRKQTLPNEVGAEVIGEGQSKLAKNAGDAIDADFTEITPTTGMDDMSFLNRIDPRLVNAAKAFAKGGALGAGAGYLASELYPPEDEEIVQAPMKKEVGQVKKSDMKSSDVEKNAPQPISPVQRKLSVDAVEKVQQATPEEAGPDFVNMLIAGQQAASDNRFGNALLRAATQAGAAIAGSGAKADYGMADALAATAGQPEQISKTAIEGFKTQQSFDKTKLDMQDENKLRDSGSDISKTARQIAKSLGIQVTDATSAKQLQDAGLPLGTLLSTKIAADARKEAAQLQRMALADSKEKANKIKVQGSVDKQVSQLFKSKDYEAYNAAKDAQVALEDAILSGDKTAAGSAFMQFGKVAQGDNSVLRDGDMVMLAGSYNYTSPSEMLSKLAAKARGGNFNETELKQMKTVAARVQQLKGKRVAQMLSPILNRAEGANLDLSESIDPRQVEEIQEANVPKSEGLTTGNMVKVRRKSDGATKMVSAEKAKLADPSKYEIIK